MIDKTQKGSHEKARIGKVSEDSISKDMTPCALKSKSNKRDGSDRPSEKTPSISDEKANDVSEEIIKDSIDKANQFIKFARLYIEEDKDFNKLVRYITIEAYQKGLDAPRKKHPNCARCNRELRVDFSEDFKGSNEGTFSYVCDFCDGKELGRKEVLDELESHIGEGLNSTIYITHVEFEKLKEKLGSKDK